ncbi:RNA pol II accessory factor, Cdc73 family-domain-containing protein [Elsinoe ampelina]|uniref:RNA pol II accessory factor, Cdc73 family-domain-containing protein n=1 Tax=Elsinoe ampelina TaxID=302913 RepID=A0A6A6GKB8_9PEZI|nr:RNA pol II accessory factor, Cdc73 family-domain-containing protein [Elsinoe ampelina]
MAAVNGDVPDPLILLRDSIANNTTPLPTSTANPSEASDAAPLVSATHLLFNTQKPGEAAQTIISLSTQTRFISQRDNAPLDLLSVYFSWTNRDAGLQDYIAAVRALDEARTSSGLSGVTNVGFTERVDLASWLNGETDESEFIKRADDNKESRKAADGAADLARGDDVTMGDAPPSGRREEERIKSIYRMERSLGDRNTVLRGIKPTDFSHVRKISETLLRRTSSRPNGPVPAPPTTVASRPAKPSGRRPEPIILLSPSASSLLRLSNIKSFLVDGVYNSPASSSTGANMVQITRTIPSIDASRPLRFILVESPENFKPDYWNRVVAVFTTGQAWQFKGYKWSHPADLFAHAMGVYVGWRGETVPDTVKGWGRGVLTAQIDAWREGQTAQQRWRDREVVEEIWAAVEASMRSKGFAREGR